MKSNDYALRQTFDFVFSTLKPGSRILEVGCGNGKLAKLLNTQGHNVLALDTDEEAIKEASSQGIETVDSDFLEFKTGELFDALVCARSFHHIHPMQQAVDKASELLKTNGKLILEEFGFELLDRNSAVWFFGLYSLLQAENPEKKIHGPKLESGRIPEDPLAVWLEHGSKKHNVASSSHMKEAIGRKFQIEFEENLPYLYRYYTDFLSEAGSEKLMLWENRLIDEGMLKPTGWRVIASKKA